VKDCEVVQLSPLRARYAAETALEAWPNLVI
jgi:hypothetical protein